MKIKNLLIGLDVGSTTVKITVIDPVTNKIIYSKYERHFTEQAEISYKFLKTVFNKFNNNTFRVTVCGSGGETIAELINSFFVQEVVANSILIRTLYRDVKTVIEIGGQDAKVIFFKHDMIKDQVTVDDMRMNGVCAGGTGAFIEQVAELLNININEFNDYAARGKNIYNVSGRCGVFAVTDIQPLINQGVTKEDIALSTFHAVAYQTIAGLAQGKLFHSKVIFEGGVFNFNPELINVFKEKLNLNYKDIISPENAEIFVAWGAALSGETIYKNKKNNFDKYTALHNLEEYIEKKRKKHASSNVLSNVININKEENKNHENIYLNYSNLDIYIGIDAGSTTSKFIFMDKKCSIIDSHYSNNLGNPIDTIKNALLNKFEKYNKNGVELRVLGIGTTGYGEKMTAKAFGADYHNVETIAHATSALKINSDASFILDIGGQDIKAIFIKNGIITNMIFNEACSAGCGAFLENFAKSIDIKTGDIAGMAFKSKQPSKLGSRCTVFMNSSVTTELKNGRKKEDIIAGLCNSLVENIFTKIIRINNLNLLGDKIILQGGTSKNDAVYKSFENYVNKKVYRPEYPELMGATGIALLTKEKAENNKDFKTSFIGLDKLKKFDYKKETGIICSKCTNHCKKNIIKFNTGSIFVTGNRCERGEIGEEIKQSKILNKADTANMIEYYNRQLEKNNIKINKSGINNKKIGLPRVLEFWDSLPFWKSFFMNLGFDPVVSGQSSFELYNSGLQTVPSDTVCLPAKISHGHILDLVKKGAGSIFWPMMIITPKENKKSEYNYMCPVIQGYSMIIEKNMDLLEKYNINIDYPIFYWFNKRLQKIQIINHFKNKYNLKKKDIIYAYNQALQVQQNFKNNLRKEGKRILDEIEGTNKYAVLIAGRPYHYDNFLNHNITDFFKKNNIPVITIDGLPGMSRVDIKKSRMDNNVGFHTRMIEAAFIAAKHPNLEMVQLISFGCGHDSILSDEITRILDDISGKQLLQIKLDEGDISGPLNLRIKSFIETINIKRKNKTGEKVSTAASIPYINKFTRKDKKNKILIAPNLSPAFTYLASKIFTNQGYKMIPAGIVDDEAVSLGKKYLHNDICFPAQVNIGEIFKVIKSGEYDLDEIAIAVSKNCDNCRSGQYHVQARKALDEAGYDHIKVVTTGNDYRNLHPGFKVNTDFKFKMANGMMMVDVLEAMRRRVRPYEKITGESDKKFDYWLEKITCDLINNLKKGFITFEKAVDDFNTIKLKNIKRKPRVCIVGEILVEYNPGANKYMEKYLEENGIEVFIPSMVDFFRREPYAKREMAKKQMHPNPWLINLVSGFEINIYNSIYNKVQNIYKKFNFFEESHDVRKLIHNIDGFIDKTYLTGEGWLIPGIIMEMVNYGIDSFIVIQPFSCMSNHISGRGLFKALKKKYPHINLLSLDFDPDTSTANIENRLQMMIYSAKN